MTLQPDRIRIQNFLATLAAGGTYYPVTYSVVGGVKLSAVDVTQTIVPDTVVCNEIRATFKPAKIQRRALSVDRDQWLFQLHVAFTGEATFEAFERSITDQVPVLGRDANHDKNITFQLFQAIYQHPTSSEPMPGSKAVYTIIAQVSPN